jgi:hypothetical protein
MSDFRTIRSLKVAGVPAHRAVRHPRQSALSNRLAAVKQGAASLHWRAGRKMVATGFGDQTTIEMHPGRAVIICAITARLV